MVRAACIVAALMAFPVGAQAQQPCTKDARAVVSEIYSRVLERPYDDSGIGWVQMLDREEASVRDIVGFVIKSPEYANRFLSGNRQASIRNVYRHLLNRAPGAEDMEAANILGNLTTVIDTVLASGEYTQYVGDNGVPGSDTHYCGTAGSWYRTTRTRFQGIDRNNDGIITRSEWRGSRQSFSTHDWNGDGVLSGEEVRVGGRRAASNDFDPAAPGVPSWTNSTFNAVDRNNDGRLSASEWYYDTESFIRADRNRDGILTRAEFFAEDNMDDDRGDSFANLDANNNGRVERGEWHASVDAFTWLDRDNDGVLSRAEVMGEATARDQFAALDVNGDERLSAAEWPWSQRSFTQQDTNGDGLLTRPEFLRAPRASR